MEASAKDGFIHSLVYQNQN